MDNNHSLPDSALNGGVQVSDPMITGRLQLEFELLKSDYKKVLVELFEKKELADLQNRAIKELQTSVTSLVQIMDTLAERRDKLAILQEQLSGELQDKEKVISEQSRKIHRLYDQIDVLNIQLSEIYASEGWKFLSVLYKVRNSILPVGSSRQQRIKKIVNRLRGKKGDNVVIKDHSRPAGVAADEIVTFEPFSFPAFSHPRVSIIVPAYNGWKMNYLCLRSIWENTEDISYEVIFADDVSTDETQFVSNYIKNIRHIRNTENLGFLKNANQAAAFANGEFIHFLNNDTRVTAGWLSSLVELMDKDNAIGMVGSKLVYPDGRLQEAGGIIWQDASGWNYGHKQDPDASEFNYVKEVDYISGASILVRKSLWDELGGFDERYCPAYAEDSDLAFSIREKGYKVVYQPLSRVIHYEGFSHGTEVSPDKGSNIKSYQKINNSKFSEKWHAVLQHQFGNGVNPFWARDRSHHKPTVVVIDHYVPHFDKDAGSRTTFQYLQLFTELGMNVKFIGDNFYQHEPYTTILQQMGIEVLYGSYYVENWQNWLRENDRYIDYVFMNRPHISIKYVDFLRENMHGKLFYYTHDLHYYRELMEYEVTRRPENLASSGKWKATEFKIFANVDVVLTPSSKEKEIICREFPGKTVQVMPAFFYSSIAEPITNFQHRKDILFVGGFTHKPNLDAVLWFANEILPIITKSNPQIRLIVVGSNAPDIIVNLQSENIDVRGFVTDKELDQLYKTVRFSIIPLRFGAGVKGKTVESLVKGLPIVSTSFGIEGLDDMEAIVQPKNDASSFAAEILALYNDIARLESMSTDAVAYARHHFTKDSAAVFFKTLFDLK
jgi:GT2 family glycosyltransferase/glycosyltransferase involved in cell wall biosynthesis